MYQQSLSFVANIVIIFCWKMKLYAHKVNAFIYVERQIFSKFIIYCKGLNSFFSSETQKKVFPEILMVENDVKKLA